VARPALLAAVILTMLSGAPAAETAGEVTLKSSSVKPRQAFFDSVRGVRISFRLRTDAPVNARVRIHHRGRVVKTFLVRGVEPGETERVVWNGITAGGRAAPDGRYRVFVDTKRGLARPAGRFVLHGHFFPVRGPHGTRGPIGAFGAPRDDGRAHEGFDVVAKCGTPLAAVRAGKVTHRGYDPKLYGNFVEIKGRMEHFSYFYAHLPRPADVKKGERVKTAERVGRVGMTGNARTIGCHLQFEIHHHGHAIDPQPKLREWDDYS